MDLILYFSIRSRRWDHFILRSCCRNEIEGHRRYSTKYLFYFETFAIHFLKLNDGEFYNTNGNDNNKNNSIILTDINDTDTATKFVHTSELPNGWQEQTNKQPTMKNQHIRGGNTLKNTFWHNRYSHNLWSYSFYKIDDLLSIL